MIARPVVRFQEAVQEIIRRGFGTPPAVDFSRERQGSFPLERVLDAVTGFLGAFGDGLAAFLGDMTHGLAALLRGVADLDAALLEGMADFRTGFLEILFGRTLRSEC